MRSSTRDIWQTIIDGKVTWRFVGNASFSSEGKIVETSFDIKNKTQPLSRIVAESGSIKVEVDVADGAIRPLERATVILLGRGELYGFERKAVTGANGDAVFEALKTGSYAVVVQKEGYTSMASVDVKVETGSVVKPGFLMSKIRVGDGFIFPAIGVDVKPRYIALRQGASSSISLEVYAGEHSGEYSIAAESEVEGLTIAFEPQTSRIESGGKAISRVMLKAEDDISPGIYKFEIEVKFSSTAALATTGLTVTIEVLEG